MSEYNALAVVRDTVTATAVSRLLKQHIARSEKVGPGRPWKAAPRSQGFKAYQKHPREVEVWWSNPDNREAAYESMSGLLTEAGYEVSRHPGPGPDKGRLVVERHREPTVLEWEALEKIAPHPVDFNAYNQTADGIDSEALGSLLASKLLDLVRYPLVRTNVLDPQSGHLLALASDGRALLEARIAHERWLRDREAGQRFRVVVRNGNGNEEEIS